MTCHRHLSLFIRRSARTAPSGQKTATPQPPQKIITRLLSCGLRSRPYSPRPASKWPPAQPCRQLDGSGLVVLPKFVPEPGGTPSVGAWVRVRARVVGHGGTKTPKPASDWAARQHNSRHRTAASNRDGPHPPNPPPHPPTQAQSPRRHRRRPVQSPPVLTMPVHGPNWSSEKYGISLPPKSALTHNSPSQFLP